MLVSCASLWINRGWSARGWIDCGWIDQTGLALTLVASGAPLSSDRSPWLCHEYG